MRFRNRDERQLERDLRSLSSQPDNDFVLRIAGRVTRGHVAARASRMKVGLALRRLQLPHRHDGNEGRRPIQT